MSVLLRYRMRTLYLSPLSLCFWMNRAVYIGILLSSVWFYDKFFGEFNLQHPVSPLLTSVCIFGLLSFEFGILLGRLKKKKVSKKPVRQLDWFKSSTLAVPLIIWGISIAASLILFRIKGVPLLNDPMMRATMGVNTGILKRFMTVFLPVSCLEIFSLALVKKCPRWLLGIVILGTLTILFMLTFKGKIFFLVLFLVLIYYKVRLFKKHLSFRLRRLNVKYLRLGVLFVLFIGVIFIYPAITPLYYDYTTIMTVRVTNLISKSPNYILLGYPGIPSRNRLLLNEVAGIARTFRIPFPIESEPLDTVMTRAILNRDIELGGLNPTVIGYGWIVGKWGGVILMSLLYGFLNIKLFGSFVRTTNPYKIACTIFTIYLLFCAIQIFSPVDVFLNGGIGLLVYIVLHRFMGDFFHIMVIGTKRQVVV